MNILSLARRRPVIGYFVLAYAIAWGGVALCLATLVNSGLPALLVLFIPMAVGPTTACLIMTGVADGRAGYRDLVARLTRWRVDGRWYGTALLLNPLVLLVVLGGLSLLSPVFVPGILTTNEPAMRVGLALTGGLAAGLFEEMGWTGFATPRMLKRQSPIAAGLTLGLLWSAWHIGPDIPDTVATWGRLWPLRVLLWMFAGMTAYRVLMTWVYAHTGSVLLAVLMHAAYTGGQLLLGPLQPGLVGNLVWWGLLAVGLWFVVVLVALRDHRHLSQPLTVIPVGPSVRFRSITWQPSSRI